MCWKVAGPTNTFPQLRSEARDDPENGIGVSTMIWSAVLLALGLLDGSAQAAIEDGMQLTLVAK